MRYILLMIVFLFATACGGGGNQQIEDALNWPVKDFSAINQRGEPISLDHLQGEVWIADFIFTNCTTVCSPMTAQKTVLQNELKERGVDATLVTFSIDPARDTPEALQAYGERFGVDFSNWHFLTGYSEEEIKELSEETFKSPVIFETGTDQITHGTRFFLVDQTGTVVKYYSGMQDMSEEIIEDIRTLTR